MPAKAVFEHLVGPSASALGRGTMPAKASVEHLACPSASALSRGVPAELSRVSVRELWAGRTGARVLWLDTGLVEEAYAEVPGTGQVAGGATVAVRRGLGPAAGSARQDQGGGREQQAPRLREVAERCEAERADHAAPPRRLPGHWAGGGALHFFFCDDGPREPQGASGGASVQWTAPSRAWSTRCGWYFSAQGFQLLRRSVEEAPYDTCKRCWKLEEGQPAVLPEEDRWQAPEQSCLE